MLRYRKSAITALVLFLFAVTGTTLVALTYEGTRERIALNERETLLRKLHQLITPERYDNTLFTDTLLVQDAKLLGTPEPVTVYRARREGKPVALVMAPVAPDGYSGSIKLLVGINFDGTLAGVRVISHHETPGLGDGIDEERSDWIFSFEGKSLDFPPLQYWKVKRDGGVFDQLTGATITPRAIVKAVRKSLLYYREHRDVLYATGTTHESAPAQTPVNQPPEATGS